MKKLLSTLYAILITVNILPQVSVVNFTPGNSAILEDTVLCVLVHEDTLYAGTKRTIYKQKGGQWVDLGLDQEVLTLYSNSSELLAGTSKGVVAINPSTQADEYTGTNSPIISDTITSIAKDSQGNLWFATPLGISVFSSGKWLHEMKNLSVTPDNNDYPVYFSDYPIRTMAVSENYTFLGSGRGVSRMTYDEVDGITGASVMDTDWTEMRSHDILDIFVDNKGFQWIGTDEALYYHDSEFVKNGWTRYHPGSLISTFRVHSIGFDKEGKLLVATGEGLLLYDWTDWTIISAADGLAARGVNDIAIDEDNIYWAATDGGISQIRLTTSLQEEISQQDHVFVFPSVCESGQNICIGIENAMDANLKVYDLAGKLVYSIPLYNPNTFINTGLFGSGKGYHILRIKQGSRLFVKKLFIF